MSVGLRPGTVGVGEKELAAKTVIIVDAFSSGNLLAPEFCGLGIQCIHLASSAFVVRRWQRSFRPEDFVFAIPAGGAAETVAQYVRSLPRIDVIGVLPGTESGVELADALAASLGLPGNDPAHSSMRRDKAAMASALAAAGVPHILTTECDSVAAVIEAWSHSGVDAAVLKPPKSAGTDNVHICQNPSQLEEALACILESPNLFGSRNPTAIFQPFLKGPEYVVDTVSWDGLHRVVCVWRTPKQWINGRQFVCLYTELVYPEDEHFEAISGTALAALDAVGVKFGAGHVELLLTTDGPKIVEVAARCHGAGFPLFSRYAIDGTQPALTAVAHLRGRLSENLPQRPSKQLRIVELISSRAGTLIGSEPLEAVRKLRSYRAERTPQVGDHVSVTIDVSTSPGCVVLVADDPDSIASDYQEIRHIERSTGLFELSQES